MYNCDTVWKPKLVVRFGKGGGISSPASSAGFVLYGAIGVSLIAACVAAVIHGELVFLLGLALASWPARDAWAWFGASAEERGDYLRRIEEAKALGAGPCPSNWSTGRDWHLWEIGAALVLVSASWTAIAFGQVYLFPLAMMLTAILIVIILDLLRSGAR